jgi:arabinofuranosyltransferase
MKTILSTINEQNQPAPLSPPPVATDPTRIDKSLEIDGEETIRAATASRFPQSGKRMQMPGLRVRVAFIVAVTTSLTWMFRHNQLDDALIYARYIRNALQGQGLVFNPGEHINALTAPLYSALTLLAAWLSFGHVLFAESVLFVIFFSAAASLAEWLAPWSGLLIASSTYFYYCIGMETALFLLLLVLLVILYLERQDNWIPLTSFLLLLVRLEGGALVVVIAFLMLRERRFPPLRSYGLPVLIVAAYLLFNFNYYGPLIPSSGVAKLVQAHSGLWGKWPTAFLRVPPQLYYSFKVSAYLVPLALIFVPLGMWKVRTTRINHVLVPFGLILASFYVFTNIPNYHWYYAPFIFFILLYGCLGVPQSKPASVIAVLVIVQCFTVASYKGVRSPSNYPYKDAGLWLEQNTPKNATVAALETGAIGWYSNRYIVDVLGLTTPINVVYLEHHDFYSWLNQEKPDYVVMHPQPSFGELAAASSSDYEYLPVHFGPILLMHRRPHALGFRSSDR